MLPLNSYSLVSLLNRESFSALGVYIGQYQFLFVSSLNRVRV